MNKLADPSDWQQRRKSIMKQTRAGIGSALYAAHPAHLTRAQLVASSEVSRAEFTGSGETPKELVDEAITRLINDGQLIDGVNDFWLSEKGLADMKKSAASALVG